MESNHGDKSFHGSGGDTMGPDHEGGCKVDGGYSYHDDGGTNQGGKGAIDTGAGK